MAQAQSTETAAALRCALAEGQIPARLQAAAQSVLDTLEQPVRVTLFGLPGAGKSSVVNLLLGSPVLPAGAALPTLQITSGAAAACSGVLADGSRFSLPGFDTAALAARAAVFAEAQLPLPALNRINVLEIAAPDAVALDRAVPWSAQKTDIALWCTQAFTAAEQAAWARAPENMKDSAILLVAKADELAAQGRLQPALAAIQSAAGEHFNQVLPLAALDAQAARRQDGTVDRDRLRRTGGQALISAIMHEANLRQQAALDRAGDLLRTCAVAPAAIPAAAPAPVQTAFEPEPAPAMAPPAQPPQDGPPTVQATPPGPVPVQAAAAEHSGLSPQVRQAYGAALDYLTEQGHSLGQAWQGTADQNAPRLIRDTLKSVQWLGDYLEDCDSSGDSGLAGIRGAVSEAEDLIQLIQVEQDDTSLFDATSILLQLKRDMQAQLAA
ncbi:hypothetical protein [Leisingera sp. S232]|uniref:hypothetical protein n=1 Tax=Leisingera sp. S232 TaxID=3415132 RepID=UPI003C7D795B